MSFHDRRADKEQVASGRTLHLTRLAALVLLLAGCAGVPRTTPAPRESEGMIDLAGLDRAYERSDVRLVSLRGLSYRAVEDLSSLKVRRLARQVEAMSKLVRRSGSVTALDREMAKRCGTFASSVLGFANLPLPEQVFVEGRACAALLVAVGGGPDPARPLVVQAEQLARRAANWLDTRSALEAMR